MGFPAPPGALLRVANRALKANLFAARLIHRPSICADFTNSAEKREKPPCARRIDSLGYARRCSRIRANSECHTAWNENSHEFCYGASKAIAKVANRD